jgi:hypothetical protein
MCDALSAEWLTAIGTVVLATGTVVLAVVAIFQDTIRSCVYHPTLEVSIQTLPPDCMAVPFANPDGTEVADSLYLRLRINNSGRAPAKNVEVYANELLRKRADNSWERVATFPPMNLKWSDLEMIYSPLIAPEMRKHCDGELSLVPTSAPTAAFVPVEMVPEGPSGRPRHTTQADLRRSRPRRPRVPMRRGR